MFIQTTAGIAAFDFNGPIRDKLEGYRQCLEASTGLIVPPEYFTGKDVIESGRVFQPQPGRRKTARALRKKDWERMKHLVYETPWFYWFSPQTFGAARVINRFADRNYRIWIVTDIGGLDESKVEGCLNMYGIPRHRVIMTRGEPKVEYEECDVVVDNEAEELIPYASEERISVQLCPFAAKKGERPHPHIQLAASWNEVEQHVFH